MRARHLAVLLTLASAASGQEPTSTGSGIRSLDATFAHLARTDSPGCAVGVVQEGELTLAKGYGMASLETGLPITPSTVFYAGSVSKQFVAAAVLLASQEGALDLDDPLSKWFPELPAYAEEIRVRDLIHHTSGVRDYLGLMALAGIDYETPMTPAQVLELIARQRELNFAPGSQELYSNSAYFLMAQLVGRATDRTLREYAQERIFSPLGMRSSHFHDDRREIVARRAAAYRRAPERPQGFEVLWSPAFDQVGSGGLLTTIEDLARWEAAAQAESSPLGDDFWPAMLERGQLRDGKQLDYAFGIGHSKYRGAARVQHGGAMFGYRAHLVRYPELATSIALLCNVNDASPGTLAERVADVVLEDALGLRVKRSAAQAATPPLPEATTEADALDRWVGRYWSPELAVTYAIESDEDGLSLRVGSRPAQRLMAFVDGTFGLAESPWVRATPQDEGRVESFTLDAGRVRNLAFSRVSE